MLLGLSGAVIRASRDRKAEPEDAEEVQPHDDDGDAGDDAEPVEILPQHLADRARAGSEHHEDRREAEDEGDRAVASSRA